MYISVEEKITAELIFISLKTIQQLRMEEGHISYRGLVH